LALGGLGVRQLPGVRLRRALRQLAALAEKTAPEGPVPAAARAQRFASLFVERPVFDIEWLSYAPTTRTEAQSYFFQARAQLDRLRVAFHDVRIARDGARATMNLTAVVTLKGRGESERLVGEWALDWEDAGRQWRLAAVRSIDAVRAPDGMEPE